MNDEQYQALIDAIKALTLAVYDSSEKISNAIDGIYTLDNGGMERRIEKLTDAIYDVSGRF